MSTYQVMYQEYIGHMQGLKEELRLILNSQVNTYYSRQQCLGIVSLVDKTIATASRETFLPGDELNEIAANMNIFCRSITSPITDVDDHITKCFREINAGANVLVKYTDDPGAHRALITARQMDYTRNK